MHKALTWVERHCVLKVTVLKELTVKLRELFRSTSSLLGASVYKALSQTLQINTKIRKPLTLTTRRLYCSKQSMYQMTINKARLDKTRLVPRRQHKELPISKKADILSVVASGPTGWKSWCLQWASKDGMRESAPGWSNRDGKPNTYLIKSTWSCLIGEREGSGEGISRRAAGN